MSAWWRQEESGGAYHVHHHLPLRRRLRWWCVWDLKLHKLHHREKDKEGYVFVSELLSVVRG